MEGNDVSLQQTNLKYLLTSEDIEFLEKLPQKNEELEKELKNISIKKEKITEKILQNADKGANAPRQLREAVNNSEAALESIDLAYKNLLELQDCYRSVEKSLIIIYEKSRLNNKDSRIEEESQTLSKKISIAKTIENSTKIDNEKNYLMANSFLEKRGQSSVISDHYTDLSEITLDNLQDNPILRIKERRVELPYTKKEVENYMKTYPDEYKTVQDVIVKEFMMYTSLFNKHPVLSRFKEAYYLCRNKEMMTIWESFSYAKSIMLKSEINPYIIAASKSKKQLEEYVYCLENNKLDEYKYFKIIYEINPLKAHAT